MWVPELHGDAVLDFPFGLPRIDIQTAMAKCVCFDLHIPGPIHGQALILADAAMYFRSDRWTNISRCHDF